MNEPSDETRPLARPLPGRAHRAGPQRLAITVEDVQPVSFNPALFEQRLERRRETEGKNPGLPTLGARIFEPNGTTPDVHGRPGEEPPLIPTPARGAEELHQVPNVGT